jgi:hypothetical protein
VALEPMIRGAITPLITPFHPDGSLDTPTLGRLVDWQLEQGAHGISVGGRRRPFACTILPGGWYRPSGQDGRATPRFRTTGTLPYPAAVPVGAATERRATPQPPAPRPVAELYNAFAAGDHKRARELHFELHPLVEAAFIETNPVPSKWIMERLGVLPSAHVREPLAPLTDASAQRIVELLPDSPHVSLAATTR